MPGFCAVELMYGANIFKQLFMDQQKCLSKKRNRNKRQKKNKENEKPQKEKRRQEGFECMDRMEWILELPTMELCFERRWGQMRRMRIDLLVRVLHLPVCLHHPGIDF